MGNLIYAAIASLDGFIEDARGNFDWAAPDEEVHAFVNDLERPVRTHLYGRRMYEVMAAWEDMDLSKEPAVIRDYAAIWRAADKVVYSRTLAGVRTSRTRLEREFDAAAVEQMKAAAGSEISIGGPDLAAAAMRAGLVDEWKLFVVPAIVGGGKRWLPEGLRLDLDLVDEHRFEGGVVYLAYRSRSAN
ncbi:MAG TPA: dihydrofolate reductase family protein [Dehalococcoidia bacterium]|jgi:dihydrofolate reductase